MNNVPKSVSTAFATRGKGRPQGSVVRSCFQGLNMCPPSHMTIILPLIPRFSFKSVSTKKKTIFPAENNLNFFKNKYFPKKNLSRLS